LKRDLEIILEQLRHSSDAETTQSIIAKLDTLGYLKTGYLHHVDLAGIVLRKANLSNARLRNVILDKADLSGVNLIGADLSSASLRRSILHSADLERATALQANFYKADI